MKIDTAAVTLDATHRASSREELRESLRAWVGDRRPDFEALEREGSAPPSVLVALSPAAMQAQLAEATAAAEAATAASSEQAVEEALDEAGFDSKVNLLKLVVEMLTGKKIDVVSAKDVSDQPPAAASDAADAEPPRAGFGIEYERHHIRSESEQTTFDAQGVVRTRDGKEISFHVSLEMQRSFTERTDLLLRAGDGVRKDPLVINFGGTAAQLQSQRFRFDLDSDGQAEEVPLLSGNSGYLALDHDGNGNIDSGSELFGAITGNGFTELAQYDEDGNGWIDDNDSVFGSLRVWSPQAEGDGMLGTLAQHGVGALMLAHADTPFEIRAADQRLLGAVRASGVYLAENGSAGTLQQIDLVV